MAERFVNIDRDTPMLLPCDLRDWVPEDDFVHFVLEVVEQFDISKVKVNRRGTGSRQYPPRMMLSLLIYSYASGVFSSRKIEKQSYSNIIFRYIWGNTHPDHDTICKFRRENFKTVADCFLNTLEIAQVMGILKVGTISVDGSHFKVNASQYKNISYERSQQLQVIYKDEIKKRMNAAENADNESPEADSSIGVDKFTELKKN